jgi:hypothetical protein
MYPVHASRPLIWIKRFCSIAHNIRNHRYRQGAAVGTVILGPGIGTSVGAKVGAWAEGLFGNKEEKKPKK